MEKLMRGELPDPRTDRLGPGHMTADEMDASMTALVEKFESAPDELRTCGYCGRRSVLFGALWRDGDGWFPMMACTNQRCGKWWTNYESARLMPVLEVRARVGVLEDGQERRPLDLPQLPEERGGD